MRLIPLFDRVVVRQMSKVNANNNTTAGGLILPDSRVQLTSGTVTAVSAGRLPVAGEREIQPLSVVVGDVIIFNKDFATAVDVDGSEYLVIHQGDIIAKIVDTGV